MANKNEKPVEEINKEIRGYKISNKIVGSLAGLCLITGIASLGSCFYTITGQCGDSITYITSSGLFLYGSALGIGTGSLLACSVKHNLRTKKDLEAQLKN